MKKMVIYIVLALTLALSTSLFAAKYLVIVKCSGGKILKMYMIAKNIHAVRVRYGWEASRRGCLFPTLKSAKRISN